MQKLDDRDLAILRVLSDDGRITNAKLAERVGLSASPCWERVRKLEKAGIIEGYRARISLRKIAPVITVFVTVVSRYLFIMRANRQMLASFPRNATSVRRFREIK